MGNIKILDNETITIFYHTDKKIVHHEMHRYIHDEEFRKALTTGLDAMKKYGAVKWLSDDRKNPVLKPSDLDWSRNEWVPQVLNTGWKYWAIVLPEDFIGKVRMEKTGKELSEKGLTVNYFHDPDEAMRWLEKCN